MDFDTAVLAGPDTDGDCGTANDELTITSPSTTIPGVANLCGTLTGQHSKLYPKIQQTKIAVTKI